MTTNLLTSNPNKRSGATLTEVLMSMMILSIGVLSLASLFPIGILNSVRATQLTHAATLKNNVASQVGLDPGLILDPDRDYNQLTGTNAHYIVDPLGSTRLFKDANSDGFINQGNENGILDPGEDVNGNDDLDPGEDDLEMVPPFGWVDVNKNQVVDQNEPFISRRYHSGYVSNSKAERLVALPDSWADLAIGSPTQFTQNGKGVTVDKSMDLKAASDIATLAQSGIPTFPMRIMFIDSQGGQSFTRSINQVNQNSHRISWTGEDRNGDGILQPHEDVNGNGILDTAARIPINSGSGINEIRIQHQELKYTCLFTVRRENSGAASVDVVVFLKRTFTLEDETPIQTLDPEDQNGDGILQPHEDVNGNGILDGAFIRGNQSVQVNVPTAVTYKSGGYILDTVNFRWYRIASATRLSSEDVNENGILDPGEDVNGNGVLDNIVQFDLQTEIVERAPGHLRGAILMPNVVQVFQTGAP